MSWGHSDAEGCLWWCALKQYIVVCTVLTASVCDPSPTASLVTSRRQSSLTQEPILLSPTKRKGAIPGHAGLADLRRCTCVGKHHLVHRHVALSKVAGFI